MPRTIAVENPGCPPVRALTFDALGLIKVIEARGVGANQGISTNPKVVNRWGQPDSSGSILAASIDDRKIDPLLAVARKNGQIEVLNPLNGDVRGTIRGGVENDDLFVGLHLFRKERSESSSSKRCTLLTSTTKGIATLRSLEFTDSLADAAAAADSLKTWNVCSSGNVICSAVDGSESCALFGGKGVEVNVWDLEKCTKIWTAKSPPKNNLGIFTPTWFTSAAFLHGEDNRKIVAGTNHHQVRLYDFAAQRRPVLLFDFRETAIKAVTADMDGNTIYFGTGSGDLASADMRTGKLLGCFIGKCSGSIRSIVRHAELPMIASCGLDGYLRFWDIKTRQLLSAVFLKQHLNSVVIDSSFEDGDRSAVIKQPSNESQEDASCQSKDEEDIDVLLPVKRKKSSKEIKQHKLKSKNSKKRVQEEADA